MALRRSGVFLGIFTLAAAVGLSADSMVAAPPAADRTISFYHIHTQERLTVTYKKSGKFVPDALKQINWIMRDWRKNESIVIDPNTIDLAWEMHEELGSREPIHIICGYRSHGTNEMLRKTRGGQASQSQHMTGRAIDITFPDVPLKRMRYSALVRERGGVGYYPTSGIPFVHIDTSRVRSWPRLPRQELALVFPSGHTKHMPAEGGPITLSDVKAAQAQNRELAIQVAQFHEIRLRGPRATIQVAAKLPSFGKPSAPAPSQAPAAKFAVASTTPSGDTSRRIDLKAEALPAKAPAPKPFAPAKEAQFQLAAYSPDDDAKSAPRLLTTPKMVDRSSRFSPAPSVGDRGKLDRLVAEAASMPLPKLVSEPKPAIRPQKALAEAAAELTKKPALPESRVASLGPSAAATSITDMSPGEPGTGWVQAPEFDEDHPEELAYRPFPLAPLLTETPSPHDPQLVGMQHPDVAATLDALDDMGAIVPMRFRPGRQLAQLMWAQQFEGKAVHLDALNEIAQGATPQGLENRAVKTSAR